MKSQSATTALIESGIEEYLTSGSIGHVEAIAISIVGIVNPQTGIWKEIDVRRAEPTALAVILSKRFGLPVAIGNDVYCATVAEQKDGVGKETDSFIFLNIGTGIAGRIVDQGHIVNGSQYNGGEIGHMTVDMNSKVLCLCGRYGCVEPLASGLGMSERACEAIQAGQTSQIKINATGRIDADKLFAAYDQHDPVATQVVGNALRAVAALLTSLIRVSNPEAIVLGGGVVSDGWFMNHLLPLIDPISTRFLPYGIRVSRLDPRRIATLGAAILGFRIVDEQK